MDLTTCMRKGAFRRWCGSVKLSVHDVDHQHCGSLRGSFQTNTILRDSRNSSMDRLGFPKHDMILAGKLHRGTMFSFTVHNKRQDSRCTQLEAGARRRRTPLSLAKGTEHLLNRGLENDRHAQRYLQSRSTPLASPASSSSSTLLITNPQIPAPSRTANRSCARSQGHAPPRKAQSSTPHCEGRPPSGLKVRLWVEITSPA